MAKSSAMELRRQLLEKKAALLGTEKPQYKTSCMYRPFSDSHRYEVDIRTANKQEILNAAKSLMNHKAAAEELGMDSSHLGFAVDEWMDDFKLRIAVIDRAETLKKIEELEKELRTVLTPKQLREIGIEDLTEKIGNI